MFPTASVGRRTAFALFMSLCPHPLVTAATATRETSFTAAAKIDQLLASTFRSDGPGAAVIVVQNGNIVVRQGYGMADLELGVPMDATNVLPVCSITKQFTAVAILQLVDAGKLKLDDTLSELVPEYPTQAPVTIEQLLRHTSGIPSLEEDPAAVRRFAEDLTPAQILDYTRNKPLGFAPGTDWKYSNTGYYLLGRVIEKVSGQSYADYVTTHVLAPAGMTHSAYADGKRIITKRVRGYSRSGKNWIDAPLFNFKQADSAGAIVSTVDDLWT